jgi:hypothetical protein
MMLYIILTKYQVSNFKYIDYIICMYMIMNHTIIAMAATAIVLFAALIIEGLSLLSKLLQAKTASNVRVAESHGTTGSSSAGQGNTKGHFKDSDI